jgi:hypothetical protein
VNPSTLNLSLIKKLPKKTLFSYVRVLF